MQIDLVSYKKKKVRIEYTDEIEYGGSSHQAPMTKKLDIPPTPEFIEALGVMASFVAGFGVDNKAAESTEVHTVHIKREKENLAVILCVTQQTKTTNAPANFNTPKVNESEDAWTEEVSDAVLELMIQAEKYVNGEYAQTELEFVDEEVNEPEAEQEQEIDDPEEGGMKIVGQEKTEPRQVLRKPHNSRVRY